MTSELNDTNTPSPDPPQIPEFVRLVMQQLDLKGDRPVKLSPVFKLENDPLPEERRVLTASEIAGQQQQKPLIVTG